MRRPISQREARRLRQRVTALEDLLQRQRTQWGQGYGGVLINSVIVPETSAAIITTAYALGRAVVVRCDETTLHFYALPHPKEPIS